MIWTNEIAYYEGVLDGPYWPSYMKKWHFTPCFCTKVIIQEICMSRELQKWYFCIVPDPKESQTKTGIWSIPSSLQFLG